jgi:hypothetical protein
MHQRLDNVGFIGTENIIASNRWREGFSDVKRENFSFSKTAIFASLFASKSSSGVACGFATDYFFVHFSLERLHH